MPENQTFRRNLQSILLALGLAVTGCASLMAFNMTELQSDWDLALEHGEAQLQMARVDYIGQKIVRDYLEKSGSLRQAQPDVSSRFKAMERDLTQANENLAHMITARAGLRNLVQGRTRVKSDDPDYPHVTELTRRFGAGNRDLTSSLASYSHESIGFSDLIAQHHFQFTFQPADFQRKVKARMKTAQDTSKNMKKDLDSVHETLTGWVGNPAVLDEQQSLAEDLEDYDESYSTRLLAYNKVSSDMKDATTGHPHLTNFDPLWPRVRQTIAEFEKCSNDLAAIHGRFQRALDLFRNPLKKRK